MPAKSKAQKRLMSWALGVKKGKTKTTSDKVKSLAKSMTTKELEKYSKTKGKLPETANESLGYDSVINFDSFVGKSTSRKSRIFEEEMEEYTEDSIETVDDMNAPEGAEEGDDVLMNIKAPGNVKPERSEHSYEWSEPESKMIQFQLKNIIEKAEELLTLFDGQDDVEDWVQAKMTVADNYLSNVRDYMKHR